jgi:hypothetical protein
LLYTGRSDKTVGRLGPGSYISKAVKEKIQIMAKKNNPRIKNEKQYEALRKKGDSKEKAARIANTPDSGKKGGKAGKYEDRSKDELLKKAKEVGIKGRSKMTKNELTDALRNH